LSEYEKRIWLNCIKAGVFATAFSILPVSALRNTNYVIVWFYPTLAFIAGFQTGIFELFVFRDFLRRVNFIYGFILKSVCYGMALLLQVLLGMTLYLFVMNFPNGGSLQALLKPELFGAMGNAFGLSLVLVFLFQLDELLGDGTFRRYIAGYYHKPRVQESVVMFLDIKDSTSIAEKLGDRKYYNFIDDFFHHISRPIIESKGEIYKYVGDEVIIVWPLKTGIKGLRCFKLFFDIQRRIKKLKPYYLENYGIVPEFRAAMHTGSVIVALIGDIRKEIVYNGDVLNTTKRLEEFAGETKKDFVVSGPLLPYLSENSPYSFQNMGAINLKGKLGTLDVAHLYVFPKPEIN
jgi:adenylate cyclase